MKLFEAIKIKVRPTLLPKAYKNWIEFMPCNAQWTMGVAGKPGAGKSSWLLKLSAILSKHGRVIYSNFEEDVAGGTLQQKIRDMKIITSFPWAKTKVEFLENERWSELVKRLNTGKYKYCIIDSVSKIKVRGKLKTEEILSLKRQFPKVNLIFVYHYRKDGKGFKGESDFEHEHDYFIEIERGGDAIFIKNRFKTKKTLEYQTINIFKD